MTTQVTKTVLVNVPVSRAYNQWTQFEEFPRFMGGVKSVTQLDDDRLDWWPKSRACGATGRPGFSSRCLIRRWLGRRPRARRMRAR